MVRTGVQREEAIVCGCALPEDERYSQLLTRQRFSRSFSKSLDILGTVHELEPKMVGALSMAAIIAALLLLSRLLLIGRRPAGLPPGPPTLPIIGNIHLVCPESGNARING